MVHKPIVSTKKGGHNLYTKATTSEPKGELVLCHRRCEALLDAEPRGKTVRFICTDCHSRCTIPLIKPPANTVLGSRRLVKVPYPRKLYPTEWELANDSPPSTPKQEEPQPSASKEESVPPSTSEQESIPPTTSEQDSVPPPTPELGETPHSTPEPAQTKDPHHRRKVRHPRSAVPITRANSSPAALDSVSAGSSKRTAGSEQTTSRAKRIKKQ